MKIKIFTLLISGIFIVMQGHAQSNKPAVSSTEPSSELYSEIRQADSVLFHAFNTCDSVTYKKYFAEDLEFYHDLGGLTVGLNNELKSFKEMCERGTRMRRELVKNSLEVYPIKNYGAIEIGIHNFYHTNKGEPEHLSGAYKFIHVWHKVNGQWKIARVISYGHDRENNN